MDIVAMDVYLVLTEEYLLPSTRLLINNYSCVPRQGDFRRDGITSPTPGQWHQSSAKVKGK